MSSAYDQKEIRFSFKKTLCAFAFSWQVIFVKP